MNVYTTDKIRNVVILGHGGAGKTSLVEAMANLSGITSRMGNVTDGNTISDYDKEEIKRKFSISTTMVPIIWNNVKVNVLDTPGYFDFLGEAEEAAAAADAAVIVVNGKSTGVDVGTEKAWDLCDKYNLPRILFVSNSDGENADFAGTVDALKEIYGTKISPLQIPVRENNALTGFVDVVGMSGKKYAGKNADTNCDVPGALEDTLEEYRTTLIEAIAETNEEMMDRYFEGDEFTEQEIVDALGQNVKEGAIVPVLVGASTSLQGVRDLLDDIVIGYIGRILRGDILSVPENRDPV